MSPAAASLLGFAPDPAPGAPPPAVTPELSPVWSGGRVGYPLAPITAPSLRAELIALGVPAPLAARAAGRDRYAAAFAAMSALPPAPQPPIGAGDVLVIAGDVGPAVELAARLAVAMRVDPASTLVAAPTATGTGVPAARRILAPAEAARRGRRLHVADVPQIVVVAAPLDGVSGAWAASIAGALRASAVWAQVDATRKTTDLCRHLAALGPVDALAVSSTGASADPASVLATGVPVAYMDGQPATPARWATLLCERLAAL